ncbi:DUF397 domain-containing protein [Streptomyces sp. BE20]|uniref:DUF397 domain-containing protein n=1 Tax=Streptomycetaceae TaxID=2062 RepID=UPI002E789009|nr:MULTISPECIES: DUF397 domain-containing protein [unclassified Streptomyces]MED7947620.1 DUF397 domain-containing protein [Streptomyces sp. BE303]MEE1823334.1 DUF397 domain-containing protein [Streptomyces sp. BE20]
MTSIPNSDALKLTWHKSSRSNESTNCVEFASSGGSVSYVRDSKNPSGPALVLSAAAHSAFIAAVSDGEFDFGLL